MGKGQLALPLFSIGVGIIMKLFCILCTAAFLVVSCGDGISDLSWLVKVDGDSIGTEEVALFWTDLPSVQRDAILSADSVAREFIRTVAVKEMVELEVLRLGLDTLPEVISAGDSFERIRSLSALHDLLLEEAAAELDTVDLSVYRDRMGRTVWYTLQEEGTVRVIGPEHLAETDTELGGYLMMMVPGDTLILEGDRRLTLDSIMVTDPELVEAAKAMEGFEQMAAERLIQVRTARALKEVKEEFTGYPPPLPDSGAIHSLSLHFSDGMPLVGSDTVIATRDYVLRSEDIAGAVMREESRGLVSPGSEAWLAAFSNVVLDRQAAVVYLAEHYPWKLAEFQNGRDSVCMNIAVDLLYRDYVTDSIHVTEERISALYSELRDQMIVPEKRTILSVLLDDEQMSDFREALAAGTADILAEQLRGIPSIAADEENSHLSRPLITEEIPSGLGEALFGLDERDTTVWLGPVPYAPALCNVAIRLVDVIPEHTPGFEEAGFYLEDIAAAELENERFARWIEELSDRYGLVFNYQLIDSLQPDPGKW